MKRKPCTWIGCVYYDEKSYMHCDCNSKGYSCLTFKEDLEEEEQPEE